MGQIIVVRNGVATVVDEPINVEKAPSPVEEGLPGIGTSNIPESLLSERMLSDSNIRQALQDIIRSSSSSMDDFPLTLYTNGAGLDAFNTAMENEIRANYDYMNFRNSEIYRPTTLPAVTEDEAEAERLRQSEHPLTPNEATHPGIVEQIEHSPNELFDRAAIQLQHRIVRSRRRGQSERLAYAHNFPSLSEEEQQELINIGVISLYRPFIDPLITQYLDENIHSENNQRQPTRTRD